MQPALFALSVARSWLVFSRVDIVGIAAGAADIEYDYPLTHTQRQTGGWLTLHTALQGTAQQSSQLHTSRLRVCGVAAYRSARPGRGTERGTTGLAGRNLRTTDDGNGDGWRRGMWVCEWGGG